MVGRSKSKHNGYTVEITHSLEDLRKSITFYSFEDYKKIKNIDDMMGEMNNESIRENEDFFYEYLKRIENGLKVCERFKCKSDIGEVLCYAFPNIDSFFRELNNEYEIYNDEGEIFWLRRDNSDKSERVLKIFEEIDELLTDRNVIM